MNLPIRWGILGAGDAASRFAQALAHVPDARLTHVWARRPDAAQAFAAAYSATPAPNLETLLASPIDAIYIGTHPDSHHPYTLAALHTGKHVLCEKPSMLNGVQLDEVLALAAARNLLFMEALKTPFFPLYRRLRQHLTHDPIGPFDAQVGYVRAGSLLANLPPTHPLFNLQLGGGSLLGIAPYEAFLALDWLGDLAWLGDSAWLGDLAPLGDPTHTDPTHPNGPVQTSGHLGPTGVDTFAALQTRHIHGVAQLHCGMGLHGHGDALLAGPLGNVTIDAKWWNPTHATIRYTDGRTVELDEPFASTGFQYETQHFCDLLRAGQTQSPILTHHISRQMMRILDLGRATLGLVYPQERQRPR